MNRDRWFGEIQEALGNDALAWEEFMAIARAMVASNASRFGVPRDLSRK